MTRFILESPTNFKATGATTGSAWFGWRLCSTMSVTFLFRTLPNMNFCRKDGTTNASLPRSFAIAELLGILQEDRPPINLKT